MCNACVNARVPPSAAAPPVPQRASRSSKSNDGSTSSRREEAVGEREPIVTTKAVRNVSLCRNRIFRIKTDRKKPDLPRFDVRSANRHPHVESHDTRVGHGDTVEYNSTIVERYRARERKISSRAELQCATLPSRQTHMPHPSSTPPARTRPRGGRAARDIGHAVSGALREPVGGGFALLRACPQRRYHGLTAV